MNDIKVKKTKSEMICRKCGKFIYKGETYWSYRPSRNYCKKCSYDIIIKWRDKYVNMINDLGCGPDKCLICNRKIVCIV